MTERKSGKTSATEALNRLQEGNRRFLAGDFTRHQPTPGERAGFAGAQWPFATILGCSDSRVPAELVFDQGLGDLFVIRVAGNIVAPSQIGSVEFAAVEFQTRLVVVLGHSRCGAIQATVDHLQETVKPPSRSLSFIVERMSPAVAPLVGRYGEDTAALLSAASEANVHASVKALVEGSSILRRLSRDDGLMIVGAHYRLETGEVSFYP